MTKSPQLIVFLHNVQVEDTHRASKDKPLARNESENKGLCLQGARHRQRLMVEPLIIVLAPTVTRIPTAVQNLQPY